MFSDVIGRAEGKLRTRADLAAAARTVIRTRVSMPGPQPTLAELFDGYSLLMGLMVVTSGALLLALTRHAAQAPGLLRSGLALTWVAAAAGLVVSWPLMPLPPLIGLGVTLVACVGGLVRSRR